MKTVFMRVSNVGKSNNKSAIAASAYRSGTKMYDAIKDKMYNYSNKKEVVYDAIMLPEYAPQKYQDRQTLWEDVQNNETASDARYCKDIMIAIPRNLTQKQRVELVNQFLFANFVSKGYACQISIHDKGDGNPHAHVLVSARPFNKNGQWADVKAKRVYKLDAQGNKIPVIDQKTGKQKIGTRGRKMWHREWVYQDPLDQASSVDKWKKSWRDICNTVLEQEHQLQVGPEGKHATIHLGPQAHALEKKGIKTRIGNKNRKINIANRKADLQAALIAIEKKLQKDKEMIEAQKAAVEHLKEKENYNQYISGHELRNNFRQIFAAVVIEMEMNQGKINECEKNLMTDKQMSLKAINIVTNGRIKQYRKAKGQIEKEEAQLQQRINTFKTWLRPDGTNPSYKKQYDDENDYLSYTIDNLKKRKEELAEEKISIDTYLKQPDNLEKYQKIYLELHEKNDIRRNQYKTLLEIKDEYEKLQERVTNAYREIRAEGYYQISASRYENAKGRVGYGGAPHDIANNLDSLIHAMKQQGPEPVHVNTNNLKADLSKGKDIDDDYDYSY